MTDQPSQTSAGGARLDDRRVLVTGGAGAIGSRLTRLLLQLGGEVIVLDDLTSGQSWNLPAHPRLLFVRGDILDETALKRVFFERPGIVFHLAAFFANQNSVDFPERDLQVNGVGTLRLLEYATLTGVDRFVYASSSSIYGADPPLPVTEDVTSVQLTTPYQVTKKLGEYYCDFFHRHHGLPAVKARFFNSFGPGEVPGQYRNVIPNFIYWALSGHPLPITGTGEESRDFTFVDDVADGLVRCAVVEAAIGEAFNLGAGNEVAIGHLAERIVALTGSAAGIEYRPRRKWDTKSRFLASNAKAQALLGFAPSVGLEEGLGITIDWFRSNWDRIQGEAAFGPGQSSALRG